MLIVAVIFLHFMIARPAGFPLTVAPFALAYFIYKHYKLTIRPIPFLVSIFLLFWPLVILMRYDVFGGAAALDGGDRERPQPCSGRNRFASTCR